VKSGNGLAIWGVSSKLGRGSAIRRRFGLDEGVSVWGKRRAMVDACGGEVKRVIWLVLMGVFMREKILA
jgi:hypothetical protein